MVTVGAEDVGVENRLRSGELRCPDCAGALAPWGHARSRVLRGRDGAVRLRPRRSRCRGCGATHVLLPAVLLLRRADVAEVIWEAVAAKAAGAGFRRIAARLGRPASTVRGWLRRFADRVELVRAVFTRWLRALDPDPVMPDPAGSGWADAVTAIVAVGKAVTRRFRIATVPLWRLTVSLSSGCLLAPSWPAEVEQHELTLPHS